MGEKSHGSQSYISLAQLTDGGESYCTTLDNISLERRLDFHVADHAKEITRKEQKQPKDMTETRLREELTRRNLYDLNQPRWSLIIVLEEAIRKESRILRLHQATTQVLIKPTRKNLNAVKSVIGESKKQFRQKRITKRAAKLQSLDEEIRRKIKKRTVFLSLTQLDREFKTIDKTIVNDGIFIFNIKKNWIHKRQNKIPLKPEVINNHYITCQPELYEMLWRKEERGEVCWIKEKTYAQLSKKLSKLPLMPREDDSLAKKLNPLQLKDFWWKRTWQKEVPLHAEVFTQSRSKILCSLRTDCFEEFCLAEIILQSNPENLEIYFVPTLIQQKEMKQILRRRLPGDQGYGRNGIDWKKAESNRQRELKIIGDEEANFWLKVNTVDDVEVGSKTKKKRVIGGRKEMSKRTNRSKSPSREKRK